MCHVNMNSLIVLLFVRVFLPKNKNKENLPTGIILILRQPYNKSLSNMYNKDKKNV